MFIQKDNSKQKLVKKAQEHRKRSFDRQKRTIVLFKTHGPGENTLDRAPLV